MEIMAAIKKDNKLAEEWLLFYPERRRQYYTDMKSILGATQSLEVSSRCGIGNPTMAKGVQLTRLMHHEAWLETVEVVQESLSESKQLFLELRRESAYFQDNGNAGRPPWVEYVQRRYAEEIAVQLGGKLTPSYVHENTIKRWWRELVNLTVNVAFKKKCLQ